MSDSGDNDRHDALIVDEGFAVLNNFKPPKKGDIDTANKDPIPRCPFASFDNAISMPSDDQQEAFLNDCSIVFTARTKEDSESYSTGETFFLPCLMKPRCALEALAHTIFHAHVDGLQDDTSNGEKKLLYDPERSGAEWWTLVLDAPSADEKEGKKQNDDDEEEDDEVGMHFDADYGLESQMSNFLLHPRVATITYLSDIGVPTLILDKRSPAPSDTEKKSLGGDISKAWLSHPRFGKHVAFDGRFLHGAPGEYFPAVAQNVAASEPLAKKAKVEVATKSTGGNGLSGKRITFLVNIWLNHCPIDAEILDDDVVSKLTTVWEDTSEKKLKVDESYNPPFQCNIKDVTNPNDLGEALKLTKASAKSDGPAGVEEDLVICNRHITMTFGATMKDFHDASNLAAKKGSIEINMGEGVLSMEVGNEASDDDDEDDDDS
ncbi:hypothetical protein ACHAWO_010357 [Cyclotella atomus]|uniref:Uncharacterized protein n=1 Tax=Cyclotella atomus TaxID=382360 RepID=A0ABD3N813_9STRA